MEIKKNKKIQDLTGLTFGRLTCLELSGFHGKHRQWLCRCSCGKELKILATNLVSERSRSCGCWGHSSGDTSIHWSGCGDISGRYWGMLKRGAQQRNIKFDIKIEDAWELFIQQKRLCALSGLELKFYESVKTRLGQTASFDRIDSKIGYINGNIQWVHKDINLMKNNLDQDRFLYLCKLIAAKQ